MNKSILLLALLALPISLSAQSKPTARKAITSAKRSSASRSVARRTSAHPMMMAKTAAAAPVQAGATNAAVNTTPAPAAERPATTTTQAAPLARQSAPVAKKAPVARAKVVHATGGEGLFRVGFRAGVGASTTTGINAAELGGGQLSPVMGFHGGVVLNIGRGAFTVQPEILYSQYGVKVEAGSEYFQFKFNNVEIPVLLKYTFGQAKTRFFVNAGPTVTYLLGGTLSARLGGESLEAPLEVDPKDGRLNYGGSVGFGVTLPAGPGQLQLEARGTYLTSSNADGQLLGGKLSVGYLIPLGR